MPQRTEYKIITGTAPQLQGELSALATQGWKPILMSSTPTQSGVVAVTIVLEHVLGS
jgi:hypothetical protein